MDFMSVFNLLKPQAVIAKPDIVRGLRWLVWEGTVSLGLNSITTSGFLAAYALALGANNLQIGVLAAVPFLMHILQIPMIWLVEKVRRRKQIAVLSWFPAQLLWFPIALIPIFVGVPSALAISLLLWLMTGRGLLNAMCNAAWNGWVRDLVPQSILGRLFSRRLSLATVVAVVFSMGAAFFVDYWYGNASNGNTILAYTYVLLFGALFLGLSSPIFMSLTPEPLMQPAISPQPSIWKRLLAPFQDINFGRLIQFLLFWGFASNLAIPFFAVYMLKQLDISLTWVIGLSILSQFFNIAFLRVWGRLADRFSNKAVLSLSTSLYLLVILGWIFTSAPERYSLIIPFLIVLHIFAGIANAGVTLTLGTISLKLAPEGESTAYLAGASLATNIGAGLSPLVGGLLADYFSTRTLSINLTWIDPSITTQFPALYITGFTFLFAIAFLLGIISFSSLSGIQEKGEVGREVILESLFFPTREISRPMSSVPGYNLLSNFPFGLLKRVHIPGIDVALGVTVYELAEIIRAITLTAASGQKLTLKFLKVLHIGLHNQKRDDETPKTYGVEIARQAALGALRATKDTSLNSDLFIDQLTPSVVEITGQAGMKPIDAIVGTSQAIVQEAIETGADLKIAAAQIIETAQKAALQAGISPELAASRAVEGALVTAESLGALYRFKESLTALRKST